MEAPSLASGLFDPAAVAPETRAFNAQLESILASVTPVHHQKPADVRAARERGDGPFPAPELHPDAVVRRIPGPRGELALRCLRPAAEARGVYLHIHGGGWTLGGAHHQDPLLLALAERAQLAVVSVEYGLAPEQPYPAAPDDCEAAALWLAEHAGREFGTDTLCIGGESAGAHLSLVTLLRLRDRHGATPFAAANLAYGCYDLAMTPSMRSWGDRNLILSTPIVAWFADQFVPAERRCDPDVSPLYADLSDLPPALLTVGTLDPLLDDSLFLYGRWLAAGNAAELDVAAGGIHAFNLFPIDLGRRSNERQADFLRRATAA
ncbi:MAG: alpha/beta hydrolase [Proteobacteria bacterium]|nr:alpha/beta hydrolase [Pseudomonadota bacterium]